MELFPNRPAPSSRVGKSRYKEALPLFTLISLTHQPTNMPVMPVRPHRRISRGAVTVLTDLRRLRLPPRPMMTGILVDLDLSYPLPSHPSPPHASAGGKQTLGRPQCQLPANGNTEALHPNPPNGAILLRMD